MRLVLSVVCGSVEGVVDDGLADAGCLDFAGPLRSSNTVSEQLDPSP